MKISVIVISYNEKDNIEKCLESVRWADELIVVDSGSRDETVKLAECYTKKVFRHSWQGYSKQKNFAISKARNEWILSLDADEVLSEELASEIKNIVVSPYEGYYLPRKAFFMNRWIKHCGWYPDRQLRLFRKGKGFFNEREQIHEGLVLKGKAGTLQNELLHYSYKNIGQYFSQLNKYTELAAQGKASAGKTSGVAKILLNPPATFLKMYVLKLGFLDGLAGFCICALSAFYNFVKYTKLWEIKRKR